MNHARHLLDSAIDSGGTTIRTSDNPLHRYVVGGLATIMVPMARVTHPTTEAWLDQKIWDVMLSPLFFETLGSWRDGITGDIYVDFGDTYENRETALEVAAARGELAIFDLFDGVEVRLA